MERLLAKSRRKDTNEGESVYEPEPELELPSTAKSKPLPVPAPILVPEGVAAADGGAKHIGGSGGASRATIPDWMARYVSGRVKT
jgi:hypothetical protein